MEFIPNFLLNAMLGGIGIAICSAPLGSFMVWRRMAYFGDALAHASLLGIALALSFNFSIFFGVLLVSTFIALSLLFLQKQKSLATDTLLGILSHTSLAFGLIAVSLIENFNSNILSFLYGDILTITSADIVSIYVCAIVVLSSLYFIWDKLLISTINSDLAEVEGVSTNKIYLVYVLLLASMIAISVKLVGVLLITALLIIPNAIARRFSNTPESLTFFATLSSVVSVISGLLLSYHYDIPAGPAIVVTLAVIFFTTLFSSIKK